jgi:DNA-binding FadR family transcriptional regulator
MRLFVGLRDEQHFRLDQPFVMADSFAVAYTGLTRDQAREAREALEAKGVIRRAGRSGRAILWTLAAQDSLVPLAARLAGGDHAHT